MKKFLSIISAGLLAVLAFSCTKEEDKAVINTDTQITAPVLVSAEATEDGVSVTYTPAKFATSFNSKMPVYHTLAMVKVGGKEVNQTLSNAKDDGTEIVISSKNLSAALRGRGYKPFDEVPVEVVVRASVQDPARGITSGYHDSAEKYPFTWVMPEEVAGCPYEDFESDSDWTVIGSLSAYEISWDGDLNMWTNGNQHVAAHVVLKAGDEFKFRKDQAWTVNMGGDFGGLDAEFSVTQDGSNIKVGADGVYDLYLDPAAGSAWITAAYDPYPDYTETSNWSIIGSIAAYDNSWNKDLPMVSDGTNHAAFAVIIGAADEFKFRQDAAWTVNLGGDFSELGAEFSVTQDGSNIKVGVAGVYDIFVNPSASSAVVAEASGLKISAKLGGDEPEPEPEPVEVKGWNIIGLNGDWDNDILASEKDGVWTAYITAADATEFKWRKDAGWDENYGGVMADYNTAFAAVAGGDNIKVAAGFYKVTLDLTNAEAPMITVFNEFTVWSLIGVNGDWENDIDMDEAEGKWVSPATKISGDFKIRKNHGWDDNRGGVFAEVGTAFEAVAGGDNINVPEGEYIVTYDPAAETIVVDAALPSNTWSLIGVNGDWNNDIFMTELMPGIWVSPKVKIESAGWKVRFNHGWDVNRGGSVPAEGVFAKAVPGGDNIALTGEFQVVYNANNETIGTLVWGVVGSIASIDGFSWNKDVPMNLASDGKWYSLPVTLAEGDEIKIRKYAGWDENFGGEFVEANTAFEAVAGGSNIKAAGTYMVVYDPENATLTLSTEFWGLIGDFNSWSSDKFMLFDGANWVAYGQTLAGGWKIRQAAGWDNNRGGVFAEKNAFLEAVPGGDNINVGELTDFDVVYVPSNEIIFIGDVAEMPEAN